MRQLLCHQLFGRCLAPLRVEILHHMADPGRGFGASIGVDLRAQVIGHVLMGFAVHGEEEGGGVKRASDGDFGVGIDHTLPRPAVSGMAAPSVLRGAPAAAIVPRMPLSMS